MSEKVNVSNACDDQDVVRRFGVLAERSNGYKQWLLDQLRSRGCKRVLDAACGTGGDALFLLKNGFHVVGSDSAEAMLCQARQAKKSQQKLCEAVGKWEIKNANWLTLKEDLGGYGEFDAVLCMGNSMINLIDTSLDLELYKKSFENFKSMLKPGGILLIDHRNMDVVYETGKPVNKNVYFKVDTINKISSKLVQYPGKPDTVDITFDMIVDGGGDDGKQNENGELPNGSGVHTNDVMVHDKNIEKVTIPLQAIRAEAFASMLAGVFGEDCERALYGDLSLDASIHDTAYFQHVITKRK
ncbi:glycine N-methyltransferase-like [Lytechinus variegatus]|uniref:glycine N-methyltransferase-like n=1 Tax=Lytechinus variegatus TaxID=7654 RepID=UPI001BB27098|nr:glycine N-methyltransferase-like [Lytechinus variegatus]XP_041485407.1 glycine N-methyltransferase-like [Lytechinus variegatus]